MFLEPSRSSRTNKLDLFSVRSLSLTFYRILSHSRRSGIYLYVLHGYYQGYYTMYFIILPICHDRYRFIHTYFFPILSLIIFIACALCSTLPRFLVKISASFSPERMNLILIVPSSMYWVTNFVRTSTCFVRELVD